MSRYNLAIGTLTESILKFNLLKCPRTRKALSDCLAHTFEMFNMINNLKNILKIDGAAKYALVGRGWNLFSGLAMLAIVVRVFPTEELGYYYSFSAVLAAQVIFELGIGVLATHFASDCFGRIDWLNKSVIKGDLYSVCRLRSLFRVILSWYFVIAVLVILLLGPAGWLLFSTSEGGGSIKWTLPWVFFVITTAANIVLQGVFSLLDGCQCIDSTARIRFWQSVFGSFVGLIVLALGGGLFVLPALNGVIFLIGSLLLLKDKFLFLQDMLFGDVDSSAKINWLRDIWPLQWKLALSWLSGYFIFQTFVPVVFKFCGSTEAGQLGLSLSIANSLMGFAMSWFNTQSPKFAQLISRREYVVLDTLFQNTIVVTGVSLLFVSILVVISLCWIPLVGSVLVGKVLPVDLFAILLAASNLNYLTISQAAYLRAFREEPYLVISIVIGFLTFTSIKIGVVSTGVRGVVWIYFICSVISSLWSSLIFIKMRNIYQTRGI